LAQGLSWDVFCRVVDNYGDAAVCWRLAMQLAKEQGGQVRLFIDLPQTLQPLQPAIDPHSALQIVEGVTIRPLAAEAASLVYEEVADVVVEAFGCGLPEGYEQLLAQRHAQGKRSLWIILEYLSAEPWVASHHGLPSPHPRLPVERYFFFPGFTPDTGGLLREGNLLQRRDEFLSDPTSKDRFWEALGFAQGEVAARPHDPVTVSLFGYENPAIPSLLQAWVDSPVPVVAAITSGRTRPQVMEFLGLAGNPDSLNAQTVRRGNLEARFIPFVSQPLYDQLLWSCDWNFVRGEDSFVRAQWAARPFTWHIYPQADQAHAVKLEAFLERYCARWPAELGQPFGTLWRFWNGLAPGDAAALWPRLAAELPVLARRAETWEQGLRGAGSLAAKLAQFCQNKLK
jgi:uncharacterized repeat protein (TIGR03837 family)